MAGTKRRNWERLELTRAVELYCRTPFGRIHTRNPDIIALAGQIGRSAGSVAFKLSNFAALDPTLDRKGMSNYSKGDAAVWEEFFEAPVAFLNQIDAAIGDAFESIPARVRGPGMREGEDLVRLSKARRNQDFFRRMILAAYDGSCALTGIAQPDLLIASHIVGWAEDEAARLDPRNGILLNALHDRAFDKHLITFEDDFSLVVSPKLELNDLSRPFFENRQLRLPSRFRPDPAYLRRHRDLFAAKAA